MTKVRIREKDGWQTIGEVSSGVAEKLKSMEAEVVSPGVCMSELGGIPVFGDERDWMRGMLGKTIMVGKTIVHIGVYVVRLLVRTLKTFPTVGLVVAAGLVIGMLLHSIPFVGWLLSAIWGPVMLVLAGAALCADVLQLFKDNRTSAS